MNLEAVKEYNLSNITSKCGKTCAKHEYRQSDNVNTKAYFAVCTDSKQT